MIEGTTRRYFLRTGALAPFCLASSDILAKNGGDQLPRVLPHEEGIADRCLVDFIEAMAKDGHELHSLMILRNGNVICEGWAAPYGPNFNHSMYSMSKSFTSTAVGFAVAEGRFKTSDRVIDFFPEDQPDSISENLATLQVKDLLTMSVGMAPSASSKTFGKENWVRSFFEQAILHKPGTVFNYNTAATYLLSAVVQKTTGQNLIEYLKPRLFDPIGIVGATWDQCPGGISKGGFGLNIRTEGLARFGQLYLQKGKWNGQQILPESWINEATRKQIQQGPDSNKNPDWQQGYGYQFWRCRHNCYRGDGAFGQFTVVIPEKNVVIAMSGESSNMQGELDLMWKHLLPNFGEQPVVGDKQSRKAFQSTITNLEVPAPEGEITPGLAQKWNRRRIILEKGNPLNADELVFEFGEKNTSVLARRDGQAHWGITCGIESWERGEMPVPTSGSWLISKGKTDQRGFSKVAVRGGWTSQDQFEMTWRYYETPHHDVVKIRFSEDALTVKIYDSMSLRRGKTDKARISLKGKFAEA